MILIYRILTTLLYPLLISLIFFRKIIKKEDSTRYKEKIFVSNFNIKRKDHLKLIWFHAASIGEFKSILPIIDRLNKDNDNFEFLITTITLSSSNLAKEELKKYNNVQHRFFPIDVDFIMNKFLLMWKPYAIFFVDSEIWPNLICKISKKNIPLSLINARITLKTFKKWNLIPRVAKEIFSSFDLCLTSNLETKDYLHKFNAKNITYTGNLKLINKIDEKKIINQNENFLINNMFWCAASTHNGEEKFCLHTHLALRKEYKNIITIIAPRHIDRVQDIKKVCNNLNLSAQILDKNENIVEGKEIIIINSYGTLLSYFKYAKSVFIGKSILKILKNVGGQNPIDAAKLGCKVYHGPYVYNFEEIYEILKKNNISKKVESPEDLAANLLKDFSYREKETKKFSSIMNDLGDKTLTLTMKKINNLLYNEII
jgi:3-deoxy-D-manno-octulosonic-acid transferase